MPPPDQKFTPIKNRGKLEIVFGIPEIEAKKNPPKMR